MSVKTTSQVLQWCQERNCRITLDFSLDRQVVAIDLVAVDCDDGISRRYRQVSIQSQNLILEGIVECINEVDVDFKAKKQQCKQEGN